MKIAHAGDWHLGIKTHSTNDSKSGLPSRTEDVYKAVIKIIDLAVENHAQILIIPGDLFDNPKPSPAVVDMAITLIQYAIDKGLGIIVICGNHDLKPANSIGSIGLLKQIFKGRKENYFRHFVESIEDKTFISTFKWRSYEDIKFDLRPFVIGNECPETNNKDADIVICHAYFRNSLVGSGNRIMTVGGMESISNTSAKLILSGHIHKPQKIINNDGQTILYSGSPVRFTFDDRNEEKGFWIIDFNGDTKNFSYEFIEIDSRPMIQLELDNGNIDGRKIKKCKGADVKLIIKCDNVIDVDINEIRKKFKKAGAHYIAPPEIIVRKKKSKRNENININSTHKDCIRRYVKGMKINSDVKKIVAKEALNIVNKVLQDDIRRN